MASYAILKSIESLLFYWHWMRQPVLGYSDIKWLWSNDQTSSLYSLNRPAGSHLLTALNIGHAVTQLVEAMRYKPEGRGFNYRLCHWNFLLTWNSGLVADSACNEIEYQEYLLESKQRVGLTVLETSTPWSAKVLFRTVECCLCRFQLEVK
jgi:hypothetical protein